MKFRGPVGGHEILGEGLGAVLDGTGRYGITEFVQPRLLATNLTLQDPEECFNNKSWVVQKSKSCKFVVELLPLK